MASARWDCFDQEIRQRQLRAPGDPLVALNTIVPWGMSARRSNRCAAKAVIRAPDGIHFSAIGGDVFATFVVDEIESIYHVRLHLDRPAFITN